MTYGYSGKILRINLSTAKIWQDNHDENWYRTYWGGAAIAGYYMLNEMRAGIDALSDENMLIFSVSPIVGVPLPGLSRLCVCAKSPLTGGWGEAQSGGFVASQIKRSGWDSVIVEGKAKEPVYIYINDDKVEIRQAAHVWGKSTKETEAAIREENNDKHIACALIGQGGENLVRFAAVIDSCRHAAARTGMGAVMGSKNLKGIAVKGSKSVPVANPEKIKELAKYFKNTMMSNCAQRDHAELGTKVYFRGNQDAGLLPVRNFNMSHWSEDKAEKLSGEYMTENYGAQTDGCYGCTVNCKKANKCSGEFEVDPYYGGPEYETTAAFGPLCDIDNTEYILKCHEICNSAGIDTISAGATIAFAIECFENGLINSSDTNGLNLTWGNYKDAYKLLNMIIKREGFGNILAEGSMRASQIIGKGSNRYVMHSKGQEFAMHEPRGKGMIGFSYALSELGAEHTRVEHDCDFDENAPEIFKIQAKTLGILDVMSLDTIYDEKVREYYYLQQHFSMLDSLGCCLFTFAPVRHFTMAQLCEIATAITGWEVSLFELMKLGERRYNMTRLFNVREGFSDEDDRISSRMFKPIMGDGPMAGNAIDKDLFSRLIKLYYEISNWDENAVPRKAKLYELRMPWAAKKVDYWKEEGKALRAKGNVPASNFDFN